MAVRTREQLLTSIQTRFDGQTDDESIELLEDITDTLNDLETRAQGDGTDWKTMYEQNDADWRKRYTERFYSNEPENNPPLESSEDDKKPKTFADLFTTN